MSTIQYKQAGDYLIPDLILPPQPTEPLSKYGRMREKYLKENRKGLWSVMLLNGTLPAHLREIDETANRRLDQMMSELTVQAGITEALKERDPLAWTQQMNNLKAQAEEAILSELIFS